MCEGILGPVMLDLVTVTNTSIGAVVWVVSGRGVGLCLGSMVRGSINEFDGYRLWTVMALFAVVGVSTCLIPWCTDVIVMVFMVGLQGFGNGAIETG
jgi:predicted MFS family arabinose efflux permease